MPKKLEDYSYKHPLQKYPWQEWTDGSWWEISLEEIKAYSETGTLNSFALSARAYMSNHGYNPHRNIQTDTEEEKVRFRFEKMTHFLSGNVKTGDKKMIAEINTADAVELDDD